MYKRHDIRIKALQAIYSYHINMVNTLKIDKELPSSISLYKKLNEETNQMLYFFVSLVVQIADHSLKIVDLELNKRLTHTINPDKTNKFFSENPIIPYFENFLLSYQKENPKIKLLVFDDEACLHQMFLRLLEQDIYIEYINYPQRTNKDHIRIIQYILQHIIVENQLVEMYLEDHFLNAIEDSTVVLNYLQLQVQKFSSKGIESQNVFKVNLDFGYELIKTVIEKSAYLDSLIENKIQHWQKDRIVLLDKVILKLALTELIYFDKIPIKVTINEYIEIAKEFSTDESKNFVNGVIDGVQKQLSEEGKIIKKDA